MTDADKLPPEPDMRAIHAQRSARLIRSAGEGIEFLVSGLRSELALAGPVPNEIEAAIGGIVAQTIELRSIATAVEAPTK